MMFLKYSLSCGHAQPDPSVFASQVGMGDGELLATIGWREGVVIRATSGGRPSNSHNVRVGGAVLFHGLQFQFRSRHEIHRSVLAETRKPENPNRVEVDLFRQGYSLNTL
jgi:hypothetical protein